MGLKYDINSGVGYFVADGLVAGFGEYIDAIILGIDEVIEIYFSYIYFEVYSDVNLEVSMVVLDLVPDSLISKKIISCLS